MKLLIITQKIDRNDDTLGFFTRWIDEFARYCEHIEVICLERGEYDAPSNVSIYSLGKETVQSRFQYLRKYFALLWTLRNKYDHVFVHMNPIYVVLSGWLWKLQNRPVALWYTHGHVDLKLKIAEKLVKTIFTAAPESFKLHSKKVNVVGHGIDYEQFICKGRIPPSIFRIMTVGRISKVKHCETLINAAAILKQEFIKPFLVEFVGKPNTKEDELYAEEMKRLVRELQLEDRVKFVGSVPNKDIRDRYCQVNLTVNMTSTGGLDKVVLESMAAGVPVITSSRILIDYFNEYAPLLICQENDSKKLADKIFDLYNIADSEKMALSAYLRQIVRTRASVSNLIPKLVNTMQEK